MELKILLKRVSGVPISLSLLESIFFYISATLNLFLLIILELRTLSS